MIFNTINDLEDLIDILDTIIPEEDTFFSSEDYAIDFVETVLYLMDEYIDQNSSAITEPDFYETFEEDMKELLYIHFEQHILINDDLEDDLDDMLYDTFEIFFSTLHQRRSLLDDTNNLYIKNNIDQDYLKNKINYLRSKPQPVQRTDAWYKFRHDLITASNAYKSFESQSTINQLIYEKCQPLKTTETEKPQIVNINTTLHHGQKYEPLSVMIYEEMYKTKVEDFGCIQHDRYNFLGASPDGINIDTNSQRYGRMLEIKNIVNREINGIPKKEYWIQMQLQMEVCDLDECDFLETKFTEYSDNESYNNDINTLNSSTINENKLNLTITKDDKKKGIIIYFNTTEGKPFYLYKPLNLIYRQEIIEWEEDSINLYESTKYNYTFVKFIYWKMEIVSCVLVLRNQKWFQDNIEQIGNVWKTIEKERITGFSHRAPNKRIKKEINNGDILQYLTKQDGCLLNFNKINGKINVNKLG